MDKALTYFVKGWMAFVLLLNVAGCTALIVSFPDMHDLYSALRGHDDVIGILVSPEIFLIEAFLISPAFIAHLWQIKRDMR